MIRPRHRFRSSGTGGFTLVELSLVLVLVALMSATAAMMVRLPLAETQLQHSLSQIVWLDALARQRARGGESVWLDFDVERHTVRMSGSAGEATVSEVTLAGNHRFLSFLGDESQSTAHRKVRYDRFGTSQSFAVQIGTGPERSEWILILGMTGQSYLDKSKGTIDAIIRREGNHTP